jgi:hypothetical protein
MKFRFTMSICNVLLHTVAAFIHQQSYMAWKPTISLMGPDIPLLEKEGEEGGKEGGKEGESHALTTGAVHVHYQY